MPSTGVVCIIGANNSGKSRLLRDVSILLKDGSDEVPIVLRSLEVEKPLQTQITEAGGGVDQFGYLDETYKEIVKTWLKGNSGGQGTDYQGNLCFTATGTGVSHTPFSRLVQYFQNERLSSEVYPFFVNEVLHPSASLNHSLSAEGGNSELEGSYLAMLSRWGDTERRFSQIFERVFGQKLMFDRFTGFQGMRLGEAPKNPYDEYGRPLNSSVEFVRELPKLQSQGNGIQHFMGPLCALQLGNAGIVLLDEPETYLHPPQAKELGKIVGESSVERDKQVLIATHDKDFVAGLLESGASVLFLRVDRQGSINPIQQVTTNDLKWLWNNPVLRYSNLLAGMFYKQVVVCEADGDCRMYNAVLDSLLEKNELDRSASQTLFLPSGGKSGVATRAQALSRLSVPTKVVLDFDVLLDEPSVLRKIVESLQQEWTESLRNQFDTTKQAIIDNGLNATAKSSGLSVLPAGAATRSANELIRTLGSMGVFIVPVGELESFNKETSREKSAWVDEQLTNKFHETNKDIRRFCKAFLELERPMIAHDD